MLLLFKQRMANNELRRAETSKSSCAALRYAGCMISHMGYIVKIYNAKPVKMIHI